MGRYILSAKKWVCIKCVEGGVLGSLGEWRQAEPNTRGLAQGEILEHLDMAINPLERAQMLCCPGQSRGLSQGKDAGKAEEAWAGDVYDE